MVPHGYYLHPEEWDNGEYPATGSIPVGRAMKEIKVTLPVEYWWMQAVTWVQGLDLMSQIMVKLGA